MALSGIKFNGNTVTFAISERNGITSANDIKDSISTIDTIKRIILSRYDRDNKFLNLENLTNDSLLSNKSNLLDLNKHEKLGHVICKLIKENIPEVKCFILIYIIINLNIINDNIYYNSLNEN